MLGRKILLIPPLPRAPTPASPPPCAASTFGVRAIPTAGWVGCACGVRPQDGGRPSGGAAPRGGRTYKSV